MSPILSDISKRILVVKVEECVRWIEFCNKGRDIIKVKNLHGDIWQVELIKRVGDYYRKSKEVNMQYLISATYRDALQVAEEMKLNRSQWIHIPYDEHERKCKLAGRRTTKQYLIGSYSDCEIEYLTRGMEVKNE